MRIFITLCNVSSFTTHMQRFWMQITNCASFTEIFISQKRVLLPSWQMGNGMFLLGIFYSNHFTCQSQYVTKKSYLEAGVTYYYLIIWCFFRVQSVQTRLVAKHWEQGNWLAWCQRQHTQDVAHDICHQFFTENYGCPSITVLRCFDPF